MELLKEAMVSKVDSSKGFLIDGYPRELDQGTRFEQEVRRLHLWCLSGVILVNTFPESLVGTFCSDVFNIV